MVHAAAAAALLAPVPALAAENHARLKHRLDGAMSQATARSSAYVYDLTDRGQLYAKRATKGRILASNT